MTTNIIPSEQLSVGFDDLPQIERLPSGTARPKRPALRRMATVFESPVGCIRRGCKCNVTDAGCKISSSPTTHIDCPGTTIKGIDAELASPRRFYRFIMTHEIAIGDIDRKILHKFMLECFESPFESPSDVRLQNKMKVKVELAKDFNIKARDKLDMIPHRFWQRLNYHLGINRALEAWAHVLDIKGPV